MFPGATAQVYYNEAGEPLGWDYPCDDPYSMYEHDPADYGDPVNVHGVPDCCWSDGCCTLCCDQQEICYAH